MTLTRDQRRYVVLHQVVPSVLINIVINAALGWFFFRSVARVPLWTSWTLFPDSIALDLVPMIFWLSWLTCLGVSRSTTKAARQNPRLRIESHWRLPESILLSRFRDSFLVGVGITLVLAPTVAGTLYGLGFQSLPLSTFVCLKALFAALLASVVTVAVTYLNLARD